MKKYALNLIVRYFAKVRIRKALYKPIILKKCEKRKDICLVHSFVWLNTSNLYETSKFSLIDLN